MIRHIVLIRFKTEVTQTQIETLTQLLGNLKIHIPGILNFHPGCCVSTEKRNQNFDFAFSMDFESPEAVANYLPHAEHIAVVKKIIPMLADSEKDLLVVDIEI